MSLEPFFRFTEAAPASLHLYLTSVVGLFELWCKGAGLASSSTSGCSHEPGWRVISDRWRAPVRPASRVGDGLLTRTWRMWRACCAATTAGKSAAGLLPWSHLCCALLFRGVGSEAAWRPDKSDSFGLGKYWGES